MTRIISRNELKRKLDAGEDLAIVEALPAKYFVEAHLPSAINIPHDQIEALAGRLLPDPAREVVVYCASTTCRNSTIAAAALERLGYTAVREYVAGKADWIEAGYPTEATRRTA